MARVTCIMMQRDEHLLVGNWIRYYGYLFGYDRLIVLDNGSDNVVVRNTLRAYEDAGVRVLWGGRSHDDFHQKGNIICRMIRELEDAGDDSDFFIPVDCDEFLALYDGDDLVCGRRRIHDYLDGLRGTRASFSINSSLYNVPGRPGWFCPRFYEKGFVERNTLLELDHGFHYPRTTTSDRVLQTDLAYLHFHNKPLDVLRSNARTKLTGFVDPDDAEALRNFNGAGVHLKRYFALTEGDYRDTYKDMMQLLVPSIQALGHVLGLTGDMFGRSEGPTRNAVMVALDGGPDAPRPFGEIVTNPPASLSRPPPRLLRFVRSLHTHV